MTYNSYEDRPKDICTGIKMERKRNTNTHRQKTDRKTDRHMDSHTERHIDKYVWKINQQIDRQTYR